MKEEVKFVIGGVIAIGICFLTMGWAPNCQMSPANRNQLMRENEELRQALYHPATQPVEKGKP